MGFKPPTFVLKSRDLIPLLIAVLLLFFIILIIPGELSESQKEEVERSQALVRDLEVQLASIKVQVDSALAQKHQMTQDVEQLTVELQ